MSAAASAAFPEPPAAARAALDQLAAAHPDLGSIEVAAGRLPWRTRPQGFPGLLQAITAQQVSNQSAAAIWGRVAALEGALDPARSLALPDEALLRAGLSRPKLAHARSLALAFVEGRISAASLAAMADAEAIATLTTIRGLGAWTAEVYLLFALGRMDVFPAGDVALAASLAHLRGLGARPSPKSLRATAQGWQPYRAMAARLLWHHWRYVTGRPALDDITAADVTSA